jgi:hypothetical protein
MYPEEKITSKILEPEYAIHTFSLEVANKTANLVAAKKRNDNLRL